MGDNTIDKSFFLHRQPGRLNDQSLSPQRAQLRAPGLPLSYRLLRGGDAQYHLRLNLSQENPLVPFALITACSALNILLTLPYGEKSV